ncbi:MAG: hypothetical protein AB4368_13780 [Xenococcaceae cyanobacterium]
MSNLRRKSKQVTIYIEPWLKRKAIEKAIDNGKTFSSYVRDLVSRDLGFPEEEEILDIIITKLEDGTLLYGVNKGGE